VALLPVAGDATTTMSPMDMSGSMDMPASHDMSMSGDHSGCCPSGPAPCDWRMPGCTCMAVCTFSFLAATVAASSGLVVAPVVTRTVPFLASQILQSQTGDAPFRPPRI
jgi:hypothetical protein